MKKALYVLAALLGFQVIAIADQPLGPSVWKDKIGSTLQIWWVGPPSTGLDITISYVKATFTNQTPGLPCKGIPLEMVGDYDVKGKRLLVGAHAISCGADVDVGTSLYNDKMSYKVRTIDLLHGGNMLWNYGVFLRAQ
jgi:hypothetical protein